MKRILFLMLYNQKLITVDTVRSMVLSTDTVESTVKDMENIIIINRVKKLL